MATERHNTTIVTPQTPAREVLTSLVGRLRSHVRNIHNSAARQTVGKDMTAAADVIEHLLLDLPTREAAAAAMVALLGRQGYASYDGRRS
jgi:predicted nuclease with RNAse H fold